MEWSKKKKTVIAMAYGLVFEKSWIYDRFDDFLWCSGCRILLAERTPWAQPCKYCKTSFNLWLL